MFKSMIFFIIFTSIIFIYILNSLLLHLSTKILKFNNIKIKKAFLVSAIQFLFAVSFGFLVMIASSLINFDRIILFSSTLVGFYVFHKLLEIYYKTTFKKNIQAYFLMILMALVVWIIFWFIMNLFFVNTVVNNGDSMKPTINNGDYLILDINDKNFKRGEIVAFKNPSNDNDKFFVKRIIALPGESIQNKNGQVFIFNKDNLNGSVLEEEYLDSKIKTWDLNENILKLSKEEYYVMGDNRNVSKDSRIFGAVRKDKIVGTLLLKIDKE